MDIKVQCGDSLCGRNVLSVLKGMSLSSRMIKHLKYREDGILVNGSRVTVRYILREGDLLSLAMTDSSSADCLPTDTELDVVFENDDLIVVNKPPFMPTHTSHGHYDDTLANALAGYFLKKETPFVFRPINRLDRNTSGLVLVAKNKHAASFLSGAMKDKRIKKSYVAILDGRLSDINGKVSLGDDGLFVIDRALHRTAASIIVREVCPDDADDAEAAITRFRILKVTDRLTMVEAFPITGRTHQLRVHFAYLGCPILGDDIYGTPSPLVPRHALHARTLELPLPNGISYNGGESEELSLTAEIPEDINSLIENYFQ